MPTKIITGIGIHLANEMQQQAPRNVTGVKRQDNRLLRTHLEAGLNGQSAQLPHVGLIVHICCYSYCRNEQLKLSKRAQNPCIPRPALFRNQPAPEQIGFCLQQHPNKFRPDSNPPSVATRLWDSSLRQLFSA